ncbi:MAG: PBP1A family penicillin-binding protein [Bacilli bacterium]|nr:PBP1A family penicillin-binding protein [Mollicutes bacterium]MDY3898600.1 PBP1A family penicillin-binding protein [Bacilli bacterium]
METNKKKRIIFRTLKIILMVSTISFIGIVIAFCIITYNLNYTMPQITNIELYDSNNNKYLSYSNNKKQSYIKLDKVSPYLIKAFISIEDKRFYDHHGVDIIRIGGALISNLKNNGITEGGSTITQQYVKTLFLNSEQTWKRKINEAMIAVKFESIYSKDEILEGYLNAIYFDHGIYGVEDASLYYFGKHANEITLKEACMIASIPKGPTIYSPIKNPENNNSRTNLILKEMLNDKVITSDEYDNAIKESPKVVGINLNNEALNAPYFQDLVIKELSNFPDMLKVAYKGLKIYTTLDSELYQEMVRSINYRIPDTDIEVAMYAMDPTNGHVLSVVGGKNYEKSSYNRATSSVRQPGSSIKPFLYLSAIENGFTPATTFKSEPTTFYYNGKAYAPTNYANIYADTDVSMLYAIATSDNIYAVKTHLFLGPDVLANTLTRFGFSGNIPKDLPSLALGTKEVSVKELTEGYAILANLGVKVSPTIITKITSFDDEVLYETPSKKTVLANQSDVYLLNETMTSIFDRNLTYNIRPTGVVISSLLSHKYAGKSGSTDTDNWMVGYNPNIVLSIWTGYDDNREITMSKDLRFGKYIWADVIESYTRKKPNTWYETPDDVIGIELNPMTGFYSSFTEYNKPVYFKKNNIPWYIQMLYSN